MIRDSIVAGLNRYRSVWTKYLEPLKTVNCGIEGDSVQKVLWQAQNLPVISNLKNVVILCGTNNLFQDSSEDIADGVIEIAGTFQSKYNSINIAIGGILSRDASWSMNQVLIKEVNEILKEKCSRLFFIYISYDSCWTVANGSLSPDLIFLDNVHLVEPGNLKLAESIFSSIENFNGVTCNNQKQLLMSYKMAVSFKLNNSDFPPLSFSAVSKPVSFVPVSLSFATACRSSRYASALSHKSLSDPTNVCDGTVCSNSVYPSKPIRPSKPVCLSNVCSSKPTISSNFYLSKPVCPRNISFSRSIRSSDVCQSQSNVIPSKPVRSSDVCPSETVCPSNVCPSKPVRVGNAYLGKTAPPSKFYFSKPLSPSHICPNKPVCLSNICLSKPTRATTFFPCKPVRPINICPSRPVCPGNVYSSKPVCLSNDCQCKPVSPINVCLQNPRFVIKTLIFNLFLVLLFFSTYFEISIVTLNIFINLILFKVIFLTNYTCLRKHLILSISLNGSYLRSMLDTVIIFQYFRTILKISTSDVTFFTRLLCVFAIFNIFILNFAKRTSFSNICTNILILEQNLRLLLLKPTMVCLFVFWLLGISITGFVIKIVFTLILGLIFITFIIYFTLKLYIFINVN